jgi:hypothetical protein
MSWIENYEAEIVLERKQIEQELQELIEQENIPNWSFCEED